MAGVFGFVSEPPGPDPAAWFTLRLSSPSPTGWAGVCLAGCCGELGMSQAGDTMVAHANALEILALLQLVTPAVAL